MKSIKISSLLLILSLLIVGSALAWRITPELQKELTEKKAAVAASPRDPEALFDLAIAYSYTNHIIDGMNTLKKIHQIDPTFKDKAKKIYIRKVTQDPDDWKLRFRLAFAYYAAGDKMDAIREMNNVLVIDPYNVWAYGYLALIYGELGEVDKAMELTRQGLKIDNRVAALHLLLSEGYYKKGDGWHGFLERMEALRLKALGY
jgi:tetratricopeptide (TPR) repeat protein